jgi:hypothetical protein
MVYDELVKGLASTLFSAFEITLSSPSE